MQITLAKKTATKSLCFHCGEPCLTKNYQQEDKLFCCQGCMAVYDLLQQNQLCEYYNLNDKAGLNQKITARKEKFIYLDLPEVQSQLFDFADNKVAHITFFIPSIHCSSCIWLLEHLYKLNPNITYSKINFLKKQLALSFELDKVKLSEIVALLASIGYEPYITLNDTSQQSDVRKDEVEQKKNRYFIAQIAVAGFVFGNVMMLSFPEYLGIETDDDANLKAVFSAINVVLSIPAVLFSGQDYLVSAYKNLKKGILHVDFPLALGIMVLWLRSFYEIFTQTGAGYLDSMTGLIFFLLVGKWFQQRTYKTLRYDRDFKSYFPIAVMRKEADGTEKPIQVTDLQIGNTITIRNEEIIPADAKLLKGNASIDYSFVTGEAKPTHKEVGDTIYAGGRQKGNQIELTIVKPVSQSYLTQLWNNVNPERLTAKLTQKENNNLEDNNLENNNHVTSTTHNPNKVQENSLVQALLNRYFTLALLCIATLAGLYWWGVEENATKAINVFTSVLIIACPCALSLGSQFALGTAMRVLGKHKFYLKNAHTVEQMASIDNIVFDKTGTITKTNMETIQFVGYEKCPSPTAAQKSNLSAEEMTAILTLCQNSTHPLSMAIAKNLRLQFATFNPLKVENFKEYAGQGIEGVVNGKFIKMGSREFVMGNKVECLLKPNCEHLQSGNGTRVFVTINFVYRGYFSFQNTYRNGITESMQQLHKQNFDLHLVSGDNEGEAQHLKNIFPQANNLFFRQSPHAKLDFITKLQQKNKKVMMVGDGLNDAGALLKSDMGIAVTEDTSYFTPASDAILDATMLVKLPKFIQFCRHAVNIIHRSFGIALLYNLIGLFFAIQGGLSPVIAAILMPVSSITIIIFTTLGVKYQEDKLNE